MSRGPFIRPFQARPPVETKVTTATIGTALATFFLWLLGVFVWGGPATAANAAYTLSLVPAPVSGIVVLAGTFLGGYLGHHTPRWDLEPSQES